MIRFSQRGDFSKVLKYMSDLKGKNYRNILEKYAKEGVDVLELNTPKDSGITANSWEYEILTTRRGFTIAWTNTNIVDGVPVVILLQYGHATRSGSFVEGQDFINPTMRPVFERIVESLWKEVESL